MKRGILQPHHSFSTRIYPVAQFIWLRALNICGPHILVGVRFIKGAHPPQIAI